MFVAVCPDDPKLVGSSLLSPTFPSNQHPKYAPLDNRLRNNQHNRPNFAHFPNPSTNPNITHNTYNINNNQDSQSQRQRLLSFILC